MAPMASLWSSLPLPLTFLARRIAPLSALGGYCPAASSTGWGLIWTPKTLWLVRFPPTNPKLSMWTWESLESSQPQPLKLVALPLFPLSPGRAFCSFRSCCSFCLLGSSVTPVTLLSLLLLLSLSSLPAMAAVMEIFESRCRG